MIHQVPTRLNQLQAMPLIDICMASWMIKYNRDGLARYEATHQHMYMYCPITYVHIYIILLMYSCEFLASSRKTKQNPY